MSFMLPRSSEIERARNLLAPAAKEWQATVREPVPADMIELLRRMA